MKISEEMRLYEELEMDSFEMVRLVGCLENVFHIKIEMHKAVAFLTIRDVCNYIMERLYQLGGTGIVCLV